MLFKRGSAQLWQVLQAHSQVAGQPRNFVPIIIHDPSTQESRALTGPTHAGPIEVTCFLELSAFKFTSCSMDRAVRGPDQRQKETSSLIGEGNKSLRR